MIPYLASAIILLVLTRWIPAYFDNENRDIASGDSIAHLTYVKEYYRTGGSAIDMSYIYTLDESDYPNGFHKLFYYLQISIGWLEKYGGYLPTLFDAALLVVIAVAIYIFGGSNYYWLLSFPFLRALYGNVSRAHHFSERAYGALLGNIYLLSTVAFLVMGSYWFIVIAAISFAVLSISSKFSWQASTFITLALSAFSLDATPIFIYIGCFIVSIPITAGYSVKVLKGLIRHSHFYQTYLISRYPDSRDNYKELIVFSGLKKYVYILYLNSPLRIFTDNPMNILMVFMLLSGEVIDIWMQWYLAGILVTLIISTSWFKFLGEPQRYLEFSIIPAFVYLSRVDVTYYIEALLPYILVMSGVFILHYYLFFQQLGASEKNEKEMRELLDECRSIKNSTILTIPFRISFFLGYHLSQNRFITIFVNIGKGSRCSEYKWLIKDRYPYVRKEIEEVIDKYHVDYLVVDKISSEYMGNEFGGSYYDYSSYNLSYSNDRYQIYSVK